MLLFSGAVEGMITSVKNNRNAYKRRTGELFGKERNPYIESIYKGIEKENSTPKSKEEIEVFQQEVQELKQRENRIFLFVIINTTLFICLISFFGIRYSQDQSSMIDQKQKEVQTAKVKAIYQDNMREGIRHTKEENWWYAIGYFENALDIIPNDSKAKESLVKSYYSFCLYENKGCKKAKLVLNDLLQKESNSTLCADLNYKLLTLQSKNK